MATQVSYDSGNDFVGRRASAGVNIYPVQTFTPTSSFIISGVSLLLGRTPSIYDGTCSIAFYTTDGNGHPDTWLGDVSFSGSTLTADNWGLWDYESSDATSITSSDLQSNYPNDNELNGLTLLIPDSDYYYGLALITDYIGATGQAIFAGGLDTGNSPQTGTNEFRITDSGSLATDWKTVSKGGINFTGGVKYAIVFSGGATNNTSFPYWALDSGGGYDNGNQLKSLDGMSTWSDLSGDFLFKIYGDTLPSKPSKPTNPTPSDADTSVDFSGMVLDWDDGGGADTFDVYIGPVGSLVKVASAIVPSTYTVDTEDVPWGETISWRVDATNDAGTTTGDTWSFSVVSIKSVWLGSTGNFIVVAADDGVFLSTDFGDNWTRKTPDDTEDTDWIKGICSSDGTYIIVVSSADAIYRSANSGTSWAAITPAGGDTFSVNKMATSDDGQYMVIVGDNSTDPTESCYISDDYGATWTAKKPVATSIEWTECDISNDGAVIAVSTSNYFYISLDSGATWLEQGMASSAEVWKGLSISGDGTTGLIANTNDNDEFFIGTNTELYSEATWAESALTSAGRALLDDATAPAQATTLELGTGDSPTWTGATFSGLSASSLVAADASKGLESVPGTSVHPEFAGTTIKDSGDNIVFYVDDDELYFTVSAVIPIEAGMVMGPWLFWFTYAAP